MVSLHRLVRCSASDSSETRKKMILYDVPVSNNGARIRALLYRKQLEAHVDIRSPAELGGLASESYLELNPLGKMPVLSIPELGIAFPESQVIESYILDKFEGHGPSMVPGTPELRAHAALVARIHDLYIAPIQGCMYKPMDSAEERFAELCQLTKMLDILENYCKGPFMCGPEMTYADTAIFPTLVFMNYILPKHFDWKSIFTLRPGLEAWWGEMKSNSDVERVAKEVEGGLQKWDDGNRWEDKGITKQIKENAYDWSCRS